MNQIKITIQECQYNKIDNILYIPLSYFQHAYGKSFPKKIVVNNLKNTCRNIYTFKSFGYNNKKELEYVIYYNNIMDNKLCIYQDKEI